MLRDKKFSPRFGVRSGARARDFAFGDESGSEYAFRALLIDGSGAVNGVRMPAGTLAAVLSEYDVLGRREGRAYPVVKDTIATGADFGLDAGLIVLVRNLPTCRLPTRERLDGT